MEATVETLKAENTKLRKQIKALQQEITRLKLFIGGK